MAKGGKSSIHKHPNAGSGGFDKNPQNINRKGRPKKIYNFLKEKGFSGDDIKEAFGELAFHTFPELEVIYTDPKQPAIFRIVAGQLHKALKKKDWSAVREIIEHIIGKPQQPVSGNVSHKMTIVDLLTLEEDEDTEEETD